MDQKSFLKSAAPYALILASFALGAFLTRQRQLRDPELLKVKADSFRLGYDAGHNNAVNVVRAMNPASTVSPMVISSGNQGV